MKVVITGAGGFIGRSLAAGLQRSPQLGGHALTEVLLVDQVASHAVPGPCFVHVEGDLADAKTLKQIADFAPAVVFHLASMPGGAAESDYAAGRRANLDATLGLFEALASSASSRIPKLVFASTIAVYGSDLPQLVDERTPLRPALTYGAHKLAGEILLADFSRRGLLDGRSLRLPGVVARPRAPSGLASAFMSELMHAMKAGEPFVCPVSPEATAWWMSVQRCVDNLLKAATMDVSAQDPGRAWPMPVLRLSMREMVAALAARYGSDRLALVDHAPQSRLESVFGRYPALDDAAARAMGLHDDGSADALIERALEGLPS